MQLSSTRRLALALGMALTIPTIGLLHAQSRDLAAAIRAKDIAKINEMLTEDPQTLHRQIQYHNFPLYVAIREVQPEVVKLFLDQGAKVNEPDDEGENAAFKLVRVQFNKKNAPAIKQILELLCAKKVDLNLINPKGETPVYLLVTEWRLGNLDAEMREYVKIFIDRGAKLKAGKMPNPIFFKVLSSRPHWRGKEADGQRNAIETAKLLLEHGADANATDAAGNNTLMHIIKSEDFTPENKVELIGLFINAGADPREKNRSKESPQSLVNSKDDPLYEALRKKPAKSK